MFYMTFACCVFLFRFLVINLSHYTPSSTHTSSEYGWIRLASYSSRYFPPFLHYFVRGFFLSLWTGCFWFFLWFCISSGRMTLFRARDGTKWRAMIEDPETANKVGTQLELRCRAGMIRLAVTVCFLNMLSTVLVVFLDTNQVLFHAWGASPFVRFLWGFRRGTLVISPSAVIWKSGLVYPYVSGRRDLDPERQSRCL